MTTAIILLCAALLVAFAIYRTIQKFRGKAKSSCCGSAEMVTPKKVEDTDPSHYPYQYKLSVGGMHCSNCARNVENALNALDGTWAKVNLGKEEAVVLTKQEMDEAAFKAVLEQADYTLISCAAAE